MDQFRHSIADRNGGYHCAACGVLVEDGSWEEQGRAIAPRRRALQLVRRGRQVTLDDELVAASRRAAQALGALLAAVAYERPPCRHAALINRGAAALDDLEEALRHATGSTA